MHPITLALLGVLAYRTYQGKGRLAELLGHTAPGAGTPPAGGAGTSGNAAPGDLLAGLGAAAGSLSSGLSDLLKEFQEKGLEETIKSWVEKGRNKPASPAELERALGPEKISWLMKETGLSRDELLAGLSRELPHAVDQLTPEGRLPTEQEVAARVENQAQKGTATPSASAPKPAVQPSGQQGTGTGEVPKGQTTMP